MKKPIIVIFFFVLMLFVLSCGEQNAISTEPEKINMESNPVALLKPSNSGPIVMRSEVAFAVFYVDTKAGISAIHGADMVEFCNGVIDFDLVELQRIDVPEDANRLIDIIHGNDVRTSVWPFTTFDCNLFTTVTPLATGTVDLVSTDNDLLVFLNPDNRNANAFGFQAHGKLTGPNGERLNFSGHSRVVWDGNDGNTLKSTDKINLH